MAAVRARNTHGIPRFFLLPLGGTPCLHTTRRRDAVLAHNRPLTWWLSVGACDGVDTLTPQRCRAEPSSHAPRQDALPTHCRARGPPLD